MSDIEPAVSRYDMVADLHRRLDEMEVHYHRAVAGARSACKGAERLRRKVNHLRDEVKILKGRNERLQHECDERGKKISRLSLELLANLDKTPTTQPAVKDAGSSC
jgi:predicted nuclease with TOPRIM domain